MKKVKGILGCIMVFVCAILIQFVVAMQVSSIFGIIQGVRLAMQGITNPEEIMNMTQKAMVGDVMLSFQMIASLVCVVVFGLWYYQKIVNKQRSNLKEAFQGKTILWIILLAIGMQLGITIIMNLLVMVFPNILDQYDSHMEILGTGTSIISFVYIVLIGPISEELIFRGVILNKGKKVIPFIYANILQALLFGIMHFNIVQGFYAFILGLVIGLVYEKRQSIFVPIVLHIIFNLSGILWDTIPEKFFETYGVLNVMVFIILIPMIILSLINLNKNPVVRVEESLVIELNLEDE